MQTTPVTGNIGAEITGLDFSRPVSEDQAEALRDALDRYLVLFIPGQEVDRQRQKEITEIFGPLCQLPYVEPMPEDEFVIAVLKEADEVNVSTFGSWWHADFSYLEEPPVYSVLHARELPPAGGDTLFADMIAAFEALSPAFRALLEGLRVMHSGHVYGTRLAKDGERGRMRGVQVMSSLTGL